MSQAALKDVGPDRLRKRSFPPTSIPTQVPRSVAHSINNERSARTVLPILLGEEIDNPLEGHRRVFRFLIRLGESLEFAHRGNQSILPPVGRDRLLRVALNVYGCVSTEPLRGFEWDEGHPRAALRSRETLKIGVFENNDAIKTWISLGFYLRPWPHPSLASHLLCFAN